jgi:hypothetical protein
MLQQREEEIAARKEAAAAKLRKNYQVESAKRLAHGVEVRTQAQAGTLIDLLAVRSGTCMQGKPHTSMLLLPVQP